jgi:uncharacterized protein
VTFQFPRREDDDLGPPPPPFRFRQRRSEFRGFGNYNRLILIGVGLLLLFIVLSTLRSIYVDWLWFDGVGYRSVYTKMITTQAWLFLGGALLFLVFFGINAYIAARPVLRAPAPGFEAAEAASLRRIYLLTLIAGTLFFAVIFGTIAASNWDTVLAYIEAVPFGVDDPQFGRDIGFYVFDLPALRFFYGWLMGMAVLTVLVAAGFYLLRYLSVGAEPSTTRQSRMHLSLLLVAVVALFAFRYWLSIFELNFSQNGPVTGAMYTDIYARLPFIYAGIGLAALTCVALIATAFGRSILLPMGSAGAWVIIAVFVGTIYPLGVQNYSVSPNELRRETPYIQRNIEMTRMAFGLDQMEERPFPAAPTVSQQELAQNPETVNNIRLLDVEPLLVTYSQIQTIRPLYRFLGVDIDRYVIDGERRQVMIAARELSPDRLPEQAQSWVNKRLQFTHGYGVVMSPVNEVVQEGLPELFLRDIPVTGELQITRPEIYYGEQPDHYVIVKTQDPEFHYPIGDGAAQTVFEGEGGASVGNIFNRLVFAWEFGDLNILISDSLTSESRILFRRNIQERVETVAPFLRLDQDPYIVVSDGQLFWIQDAYTTTNRFPYSEPSGNINYIRNSVKVVISAYDGSMTFYIVDEADPIIRTYARIFPEMFTSFDDMPANLRNHIRYPVDLFLAQVDKYRVYHLRDAGDLYNREDIWNFPRELSGGTEVPVQPYYVIMRIPGEPAEEFALIMPLTPAQRENTIAWVAARSDGENYGRLLAFRFPTNTLVFGPRQIESRIDQDPLISQQLSLWERAGSSVIRGNLLMIPVGESNLFVEPIYLQAATSQLPELKRVVVVNGNRIAMEPTLDRALDVVFGRAPPSALEGAPADGAPPVDPPRGQQGRPPPTTDPDLPGTAGELARQADAAFQRAQAALQRGDFATYGTEIVQVQQFIQRLVALTENP